MPADPSSRKQNRGGPRKWWREYYHDHPGTSTRHPDSQMGGSKVKVYCKECMRQNIAKVQADDQIEVEQGVRAGGVRSTEVITEYLWTLNMQVDKTRGYLNSRSDTLLVHLKHCPYQPESVRDRAVRELELRKPARGGPPKHGHSGTHSSDPEYTPAMSQYHDSAFYHTFPASAPAPSIPIPIPAPSVAHQGTSYSPAIPLGTQTPDTVLPQSDGAGPSRLNRYPSTSSIGDTVLPHTPWAGASASTSQPPSSSASPLPGFPPLPADWPPPSPSPLAHTRSASRPPSLGPLRSRHSSRGFHPYHSPSPASPALGPEQWTAARQSLFESYMIRLTASAGLPFSWIENPVWLSFCDEFLPSAKVPSRTTLSRRLLRDEVKLFRTQAVKRTAGANATLQADGWTGINNHHLVAFMLTGKREVHAVRVIDTSSERKTADKFLKHIEDVLNETSKEWKVKIIAFTSDASGESRAARIRLLSRYPYLIILDCYAHQINLIVGDYLECKSLLLDVADDAEELITWLRKRTLVLARLRGVQAQNGRTAAAVIRPVKTRWTSHYLAFKRLLELQPAIAAILAEDQLRGESTFMAGLTKADAKAKARRMMELMNNGTFWHSLTRIKLHLEPLAIAANVAQTAHCRLDQVLLTFGFLYHRFSNLPPDVSDAAATSAVCDSIEERWRKADQAVFVAAVVLNPVYMLQPFAGIPELSVMQLQTLLSQLWTRFFSSPAPLELRQDLKDYLNKSGHFEVLPGHVESELKLAQAQRRFVDPVALWEDTRVGDRPLRPLAQLACHILSVCANSASCERLFSIFGQLLTKIRNRLGTGTLTGLAELKMHLRAEYSRTHGMKERLKRHCGRPEDKLTSRPELNASAAPAATGSNTQTPGATAPGATAGSTPTATASSQREASPSDDELELDWDMPSTGTRDRAAHGELRAIHEALSGARNQDTDYLDTRPSAQYCEANGQSRPFARKICELFDFDSPAWVRRVEGFASLGLDQELELYELLDFDAPGEDAGIDSSIPSPDTDLEHGLALDIDLDDVAADIIDL